MPPRTIADYRSSQRAAALDSSIHTSKPTEINNMRRECSTLAKENLNLKNIANERQNMAVSGVSAQSVGFFNASSTASTFGDLGVNEITLGSANTLDSPEAINSCNIEVYHAPATKVNSNSMCYGKE